MLVCDPLLLCLLVLIMLKRLMYSGRCLMGSPIMVSIRYWNQIYPDLQVTNYSVLPKIG